MSLIVGFVIAIIALLVFFIFTVTAALMGSVDIKFILFTGVVGIITGCYLLWTMWQVLTV